MAMTPVEIDGTGATQQDPYSDVNASDITPRATRDFWRGTDPQGPRLENILSATHGLSTGYELSWSWSTESLSLTPSLPRGWEDAEDVDLPSPAARDEIGAARDKRLTLLARKYEGRSLGIEEEARLKLVTEKLRRLVPRVTPEDLEALSDIAEKAVQFDDRHQEIRRRLGLE